MGKFMRNCAIAAVTFIVVGLIMVLTTSSVIGKDAVSNVVDEVTDGKFHINQDGIQVDEDFLWGKLGKITVNADSNLDDNAFDKKFEIYKKDVTGLDVGTGVENVQLSIGACSLKVVESKDDHVYVDAKGIKKMQAYINDGTLKVIAKNSGKMNELRGHEITLYLPAKLNVQSIKAELGAGDIELGEIEAKKAEFEVGAGSIEINALVADKINVKVGAGEVALKNVNIGEMDCEVGLGEFELSGDITKKAKIECAMGNVDLNLARDTKDYNYEVECAMGNIDIGSKSFSALSEKKSIDNDADRELQLTCSMGNITVK